MQEILNRIVRGFQASYEVFQVFKSSDTTNNFIESVNFSLGLVGLHTLIRSCYFHDREVEELYQDCPLWQQRAWKMADFLGNLSLILGAVKSRPAIAMGRWTFQRILSAEHFQRYFGHQGYLPGEKIHYILGLLTFILGLPSTLKTIYSIYLWIHNHPSQKDLEEKDAHLYTPIPVRKRDVVIMMATVSKTAERLLRTPRKQF